MSKIQTSAGLLIYRMVKGVPEFLLVHPSGDYNAQAPFYIPKGQIEEGETQQDAAIRETQEETGIKGNIVASLGHITYKTGRKRVFGFLAEYQSGKVDSEGNAVGGDWENDIKRFFKADEALKIIRPEMREFIERALAFLGKD